MSYMKEFEETLKEQQDQELFDRIQQGTSTKEEENAFFKEIFDEAEKLERERLSNAFFKGGIFGIILAMAAFYLGGN